MKIKTAVCNGYDEYTDEMAAAWELAAVVYSAGKISADLMTECKSWKTALRRFFKAVGDIPELSEWADGLRESCENGYFEDRSQVWDGGKLTYTGDWAYCVEDYDGAWYVSLIVRRDEPAQEAPENTGIAAQQEEAQPLPSVAQEAQEEGQQASAKNEPSPAVRADPARASPGRCDSCDSCDSRRR